jgi:hypothetical protein
MTQKSAQDTGIASNSTFEQFEQEDSSTETLFFDEEGLPGRIAAHFSMTFRHKIGLLSWNFLLIIAIASSGYGRVALPSALLAKRFTMAASRAR